MPYLAAYYSPGVNTVALEIPARVIFIDGEDVDSKMSLYMDYRGFSFKVIKDKYNKQRLNCSFDMLLQAIPYATMMTAESKFLAGFSLITNGSISIEKTFGRFGIGLMAGNSFHPYICRKHKWMQQDVELGFNVCLYHVFKKLSNVATIWTSKDNYRFVKAKVCHKRLLVMTISAVVEIDYIGGNPESRIIPRLSIGTILWGDKSVRYRVKKHY